jgi:hypothetical protein
MSALQWIFYSLPDVAGILLAALSLAVFFVPKLSDKLREHVTVGIIAAVVLALIGVGGVVSNSVQKHADQEAAKKERDQLQGQITKLLDQQTLTATQATIMQSEVKTLTEQSVPKIINGLPQKGPPPDLRLQLVYPRSASVYVYNSSKAGIAEKPKYQLTLADIDNLDPGLLPITTQEGDYIRPGEGWGPNSAMSLPGVMNIVKSGDRVFGYGLILCPDCLKTRSYWIYIEQGRGGWYCEMKKPGYPYNRAFYENLKLNLNARLDQLAPAECRQPIAEHAGQ